MFKQNMIDGILKSSSINYMGNRKRRRKCVFSRFSAKITVAYVLVSAFWIVFPDYILKLFELDSTISVFISMIKGWVFIGITGLMLYLLIKRDVRALQASEELLRKKDEMYRLLINGTTNGLWEWDIKTNNLYLSPALKEKAGYKEDDNINCFELWAELLHPEDSYRFLKELDDYIKGEMPRFSCEHRIRMKDKGYLWIHTKGQGIWNDEGDITSVIGTHTEINERKEAEQKLLKTNEENIKLINEVLAYERLKTEFFTNISHEFRTPLNVLLGSVHLIEVYQNKCQDVTELKSKLIKHTQVIKQNSYRLLKLINNLIDITKIDTGDLKSNLQYCNIVDVIEEITCSAVGYVQGNSIALNFNTEKEEIVTACDISKIERIMLNLLSNATKYNKHGGSITVNVRELDDNVLISVKDTGIGIPLDKQGVIFDRFRQVNSSLTREHEGSGIGLSIVKSLVEMHEGEIWVESEPGIGSEFSFRLPIKQPYKHVQNAENCKYKKCLYMAGVEFSDIYKH